MIKGELAVEYRYQHVFLSSLYEIQWLASSRLVHFISVLFAHFLN